MTGFPDGPPIFPHVGRKFYLGIEYVLLGPPEGVEKDDDANLVALFPADLIDANGNPPFDGSGCFGIIKDGSVFRNRIRLGSVDILKDPA